MGDVRGTLSGSTREDRECLVVDEAVADQGGAAGEGIVSVKVREPPASLFDDELDRGVIPRPSADPRRDISVALRHRQVAVSLVGPDTSTLACDRRKRTIGNAVLECSAPVVIDRSLGERRGIRHRDALAVAKRAQ